MVCGHSNQPSPAGPSGPSWWRTEAEQVLLEPDTLVAGYEQVIAFLEGISDQLPILEEMPSPVVGGVYFVVRERVS